jgi:hypothetical protein
MNMETQLLNAIIKSCLESAKEITKTFVTLSGNGIKSDTDLKKVFESLVQFRISIASQVNAEKGNRLLKWSWESSYDFFVFRHNNLIYNFPSFAFVVMYYESLGKRLGFRRLNAKGLSLVFGLIYDTINEIHSAQTLVSEQDYIVKMLEVYESLEMFAKTLDELTQISTFGDLERFIKDNDSI